MKARCFRLIVVCLSLLCSTLSAETLVKVVGNHAPPYRIVDGAAFSGIYYDVMKEVAKRLELQVQFVDVPFKRALSLMESGEADIMLGPNRKPERERYMVYTEATLPRENKAFYVNLRARPIERYEDLYKRNVIVHLGKVYFDRFDDDEKLKKLTVQEYIEGIKRISIPLADQPRSADFVLIMPEQEGDYLLKTRRFELKKSPYIVQGNLSYITISKKSELLSLKSRIETAVGDLKSEGVFYDILNRYK